MVIAKVMKTYHVKDLIQTEGGEFPGPRATVDSQDRMIRRRHCRHPVVRRDRDCHQARISDGGGGGNGGVRAGQDLPAYVTYRPVQMMSRLEHDLLSRHAGTETAGHSSIKIRCTNGRLEIENGDGIKEIVQSVRSARDRHEQNVELFRDREEPGVFSVQTIKPIRRGQLLLIWYEEGLARELGVPILTPANIRGNQEYICTLCQSTFTQPNILKAHLFLECGPSRHAQRAQSTLVPFHDLLKNISARHVSSPTSIFDSKGSIKTEPNQSTPCGATILVNPSLEIQCGDTAEDGDTSFKEVQGLPKSRCGSIEHSNDRHFSNIECSQSDLSPSLSSSSLDSSFLDDNGEVDQTTSSLIPKGRSSSLCRSTNSAFRRPFQSIKGTKTQEDTVQVPDSSTDQRSALNLSVKEDHYSFLQKSFNHKNILTHQLNHPWTNPRAPILPHHIGVYPNNYSQLPMCYPAVTNNTPSTSFNYISYYNQHKHLSRTGRDCFGSQSIQNTDIHTLTDQQPPERDHMIPAVSFTNPETHASLDDSSAPVNPYGLSLPSDKEPLDLLPQTYFTNKSKRGHLCLYCGKLYSRKYGLKIHMRTHNGYKPLKCKICSRPFGDPSNLNKHVRLHAQGETPYRCDYCGKVLVRRRDLERHVRSRHPMGTISLDTSSPPSSPISVDDVDTSSSYQEPFSSL